MYNQILITLFLFFFINSTEAQQSKFICPELNGLFKCEDSNSSRNLMFKTEIQNGVFSYTINNTHLIANNIPSSEDDHSSGQIIYKTSCLDEKLIVESVTEVNTGLCSSVGKVNSTTIWSLNQRDIDEVDQTQIICPNKKPYTINKKTICKKIEN